MFCRWLCWWKESKVPVPKLMVGLMLCHPAKPMAGSRLRLLVKLVADSKLCLLVHLMDGSMLCLPELTWWMAWCCATQDMCIVNSDVGKFIVLIDVYYYRSVVPKREYCSLWWRVSIGRLYCLLQAEYQLKFVGCTAHDWKNINYWLCTVLYTMHMDFSIL